MKLGRNYPGLWMGLLCIQLGQAVILILYFSGRLDSQASDCEARIEELHAFHLREENRLCLVIETAEKAMHSYDAIGGGHCYDLYQGLLDSEVWTQMALQKNLVK